MNKKALFHPQLYQQLLLGILLVAVCVGLVGYIVVYSYIQSTIENYAGKTAVDITRLTIGTFNQRLDEKLYAWDTYFHSTYFLTAARARNAEFEAIPDKEKVIAARDRLWIDGKVDEKNSDWYRKIAEDPQSLQLKTLANRKPIYDPEHSGISEIFFTNTYGATVFISNRTTDYNQADEDWWQNAMKDRVFIGKIEYDHSSKTYGITIGIRIDDDGKPLGVVKVVYDLTEAEHLISTLVSSRISESKEVAGLLGGKLVDTEYNIIYSIGPVAENTTYKKTLQSTKANVDSYSCCITVPVNHKNTQLLLAYSMSWDTQRIHGVHWGLVLEYDTDILFTPLQRIKMIIAGLMAVVILILCIYTYLFFKPIVKVIQQLEMAMGKVIEGDLTVQTHITRQDELGSLANHFDQMVERLRAAIQAKQDFLSIATHSLKAPLTGMKWNIELVLGDKQQKLTAATKKTLTSVHQECIQMVNVITDVLRANKLSAATKEKAVSFDPIQFIQSIKQSLECLGDTHHVTLHLPAGELGHHIYIDQDVFKNIVENLISNAAKYSHPQGQVTMNIIAEHHAMHLSVEDTGIGIPKDEQKKIFTQFFRASNSVTHQAEGSGLGLFIIHNEVKRWGGTIRFVSQEGKGSTFTITLPLKK